MNRRLKRILIIYAFGTLLVLLSSFVYAYFKSNFVFLAIIALTFLVSYLMPLWFKLFLKAKTYKGKYRNQLLDYSNEHGLRLKDILLIKSKHSNACAFSFANNKTVCFNSNSIDNHPWEEIQGVMAHEIGHHKNGDIYLYTLIVAILLSVSSWISTRIYDLLFNNWYWLIVISLVMGALLLPLVLRISRWREGMADSYAKITLDKPVKLANFLERMLIYEEKLGERVPNKLSYLESIFLTHPWIFNRIKTLKAYERH